MNLAAPSILIAFLSLTILCGVYAFYDWMKMCYRLSKGIQSDYVWLKPIIASIGGAYISYSPFLYLILSDLKTFGGNATIMDLRYSMPFFACFFTISIIATSSQTYRNFMEYKKLT